MDTELLAKEIAKRREALIDKSRNNPLVNLRLGNKRSASIIRFIDECNIDHLSRRVVNGLTIEPSAMIDGQPPQHEAGAYILKRSDDQQRVKTDLIAPDLDRRLVGLMRKAKNQQDETGLNPLHLALGTLRWKEASQQNRVNESPVLLFPLQITRTQEGHKYNTTVSSTEDAPELNQTLVERLDKLCGLRMPEYDPESHTPETYLWSLVKLFANDPVDIVPTATIAMLPTSRMALWRDLEPDRWAKKSIEGHPLLSTLLGVSSLQGAATFSGDHDVDALCAASPASIPKIIYDADSSQMSVLIDLRSSSTKSLAIEGPPGTGKSQTIANIIGDAVAQGRTILFVAEKQTALDVVAAKMKERGFGPLLLEMHSDTATKGKVLEQVKKRIEASPSLVSAHSNDEDRIERLRSSIRARMDSAGIDVGNGLTFDDVHWKATHIKSELSRTAAGLKALEAFELMEDVSLDLEDAETICPEVRRWHELAAQEHACDPWAGFDLTNRTDAGTVSARASAAARAITAYLQSPYPSAGRYLSLERIEALASMDVNLDDALSIPGDELTRHLMTEKTHQKVVDVHEACAGAHAAATNMDPVAPRIADKVEPLLRDLSSLGFRTLNEVLSAIEEQKSEAAELSSFVATMDGEFLRAEHTPEEIRNRFEALHLAKEKKHSSALLRLSQDPSIGDRIESLRILTTRISRAWESAMSAFIDDVDEQDDVTEDMELVRNAGMLTRAGGSYKRSLARLRSLLRNPPSNVADMLVIYDRAAAAHEDVESLERPDWLPAMYWDEGQPAFETLIEDLTAARHFISACRKAGISHEGSWVIDPPTVPARLGEIIPKFDPDLSLSHDISRKEARLDVLRDILVRHEGLPHDFEPTPELAAAAANLIGARIRLSALGDCNENESRKALSSVSAWKKISLSSDDKAAILKESCVHDALVQSIVDARETLEAARIMEQRINGLEETLGNDLARPTDEKGWHAIKLLLEQMASPESSSSFDRNVAMSRSRRIVRNCGAEVYLDGMPAGIDPEHVESLVRLSVYRRKIYDTICDHDIDLDRGHIAEEDSVAFREMDGRQKQDVARRIVDRCIREASPPEGVSSNPVSSYTQMSLLRHEAKKTTRHIPLRQLVTRAGTALQELMPIWLMSPSSVAQAIPPGILDFDLLIIDEASQMRPESALGSILRSRQAVIVGDQNQMPPSRQFEVTDGDEIDEDQMSAADDAESILDLANARFPVKRRLKWHYRSQHQSLIAFSDANYYDRELIYMPAPRDPHGLLGVHSHYVADGTYAGHRNVEEAAKVVEMVRDLARTSPHATIGVVALNSVQSDYLLDLIEEAALEDEDLRAYMIRHEGGGEGLIVKNLENVQGHERDIILVSTVYGPGAGGRIEGINHSPVLNRAEGHRRLNVLVTRARLAVHVFTSLKPGDIKEAKNRGVGDFRRYLEYAQSRQLQNATGQTRDPDSEFEKTVAGHLRDAGFQVDYQIGVDRYWIDLGIRHPTWEYGYIAGVECDGAPWHRGLAVRDRDRIRQSVLENMGWKIFRCWSSDWYLNHRAEVERLVRLLNERLEELQKALEAEQDLTPPVSFDRKSEDSPMEAIPPAVEAEIAAETRHGKATIVEDALPDPILEETNDPNGGKVDSCSVEDMILPADPDWKVFHLDGKPYYEVVKGLEYAVWSHGRGEIGRIHTQKHFSPTTVLASSYRAVTINGDETYLDDIYAAIRWVRQRLDFFEDAQNIPMPIVKNAPMEEGKKKDLPEDVKVRIGSDRIQKRQIDELIGLSRGILIDGKVDQAEAEALQRWLISAQGSCQNPLLDHVFQRVEAALSDGMLDEDESRDLFDMLTALTADDYELGEQMKATTLPLCTPVPPIVIKDKTFTLTGTFITGKRRELEQHIKSMGGKAEDLTSRTDYLVIGEYATDSWKHSNMGTKIEKAMGMRSKTSKPFIISEAHWRKVAGL